MQHFGSFDYVIVGAGSAGCLLANRLSQKPENEVLVLEAGGKDDFARRKIAPSAFRQFKSADERSA